MLLNSFIRLPYPPETKFIIEISVLVLGSQIKSFHAQLTSWDARKNNQSPWKQVPESLLIKTDPTNSPQQVDGVLNDCCTPVENIHLGWVVIT